MNNNNNNNKGDNNNNGNDGVVLSNINSNIPIQANVLTISDDSPMTNTEEYNLALGVPSTYGGGKRRRERGVDSSLVDEPVKKKPRLSAVKANESFKKISNGGDFDEAGMEENKNDKTEETQPKPKRRRGRQPKQRNENTDATKNEPRTDPSNEDESIEGESEELLPEGMGFDFGDLGDFGDLLAEVMGGSSSKKKDNTTTTKEREPASDGKSNVEGTVSNLVVKEEKIKPIPIESMIGVDETLAEINTLALKIKYSERFNFEDSVSVDPSKSLIQSSVLKGGLMLFGPPGGGKTIMASVLVAVLESGNIKVHFFNESPSKILSPYVGESEKYVDTLFKTADDTAKLDNLAIFKLKTNQMNSVPQALRKALEGFEKSVAIIYIDEGDAVLTPTTGPGADSSKNSVVTTFQSAILGTRPIDNTKFVISTNFPWKIPLPVRQRFTRSIYIGVPDDESRYLKILYRIYQRIYKRDSLKALELANNTTQRKIQIMEEKLAPEFAKIEDCVSIVNRFVVDKFGIFLGLKPITLEWIKYYLIPILGRRDQIKSQALREKIARVRRYIVTSPASGQRVLDIESELDRLYDSQYLGEGSAHYAATTDRMETDSDHYYSTVSTPSTPKNIILRGDSEEVKFNDDDEGIGGVGSYEESNDGFGFNNNSNDKAPVVENIIHEEVALHAPVINITVNTGNGSIVPLVNNNTNVVESNNKLSEVKTKELEILKRFAQSTVSVSVTDKDNAIPNELVEALYSEFGGFDDFLKTMENPDAAPVFKLSWPSAGGNANTEEFTLREAIQIINEHHLAQRGIPARNNMTKLEFGLSLRELDQKISAALDSCTELIHTLPYPTKYLFSPNVPLEKLQAPGECKFILGEYKDYLHFASGYWTQLYTPQKYTKTLRTPEGSIMVDAGERLKSPKPISREYPPVFDEQDFNQFNFYNLLFNHFDNPSNLQISPYLITRNAFTSALAKLDPSLDPETHVKYIVYSKTK